MCMHTHTHEAETLGNLAEDAISMVKAISHAINDRFRSAPTPSPPP